MDASPTMIKISFPNLVHNRGIRGEEPQLEKSDIFQHFHAIP